MSSGEFFGYIASGLVFIAFDMRMMLPLRRVEGEIFLADIQETLGPGY